MPRDARHVVAGLQGKGFRRRENDHLFLHLWVDGRKTTIFTKISHGEKQIGDKLLSLMARQVRLNRRQFLDLVDCPMTSDQYVQVLRDAGHVG